MILFLDANICLDLLDDTRKNSKDSIEFYKRYRDNAEFFFSGDFITTIYYVLTQRKKRDNKKVVKAIELLSNNIKPAYLNQSDFVNAKIDFQHDKFYDFEDLLILNSAIRINSSFFITNDKELLSLKKYSDMTISSTKFDL